MVDPFEMGVGRLHMHILPQACHLSVLGVGRSWHGYETFAISVSGSEASNAFKWLGIAQLWSNSWNLHAHFKKITIGIWNFGGCSPMEGNDSH